MMGSDVKKNINIILPVFNEGEGIMTFYNELISVIGTLNKYNFLLLFVNDGSTDNSKEILEELSKKDERVRLFSFSRNFGHQAALMCGIKNSSSDAIITMDTDLQHPPALIPELINKWEEGYDIVNTVRQDQESIGWLKKLSSKMFYSVFNMMSESSLQKSAADFRLISSSVARVINEDIEERNIFLRGLVSWLGFKQCYVDYKAQLRQKGESKFTLRKMFSLANNGLSYFSLVPIKLGLYIGVIFFTISFLYLFISIIYGLVSNSLVPGWTSLVFFLLLLSSVQFILIGILGIYIGHIFTEVKSRPSYIVESTKGFNDTAHARHD
ncbi:MAG: glycosyltransferase family 2 protein [Saprospiraceae bacterium]|nr:glycosyltransferase family 2 protein [Bacteroidia bacterium]NNK89264.1 glycosyltransferase family 2 protein [Saprospiraceae bacterium]